jgi:(2Fe-2S) ferredoxin
MITACQQEGRSLDFYRYHVFFCTNLRAPDAPRPSCGGCGSEHLRTYAKQRVSELGLNGPGRVRINQAGCMERCEQGPAVVIYPEGIWYRCRNTSDVDAIIEQHLLQGRVVERLRI